MKLRRETVEMEHVEHCRILHISDVHFSARTTHEQNLCVVEQIVEIARHCKPISVFCVTGDLVSRKTTPQTFEDALFLLQTLRKYGEVLYSCGNHEMDLTAETRAAFFARARSLGVTVLDNKSAMFREICFTGLTLPQSVFKNPDGSYLRLSTITREMVENCVGSCLQHPAVLLAHTPLGLSAYAEWGADLVLSGHVHGGIVRVGKTGLLSPERRFLPRYTKGMFRENGCIMNVSAGIGKFRFNNPAELVCVDITPKNGHL